MRMLSDELVEKMRNLDFTDEQIKFVDEELVKEMYKHNRYKIMAGQPYFVIRDEHKGGIYYSIRVRTKNLDGHYRVAYKAVQFLKCDPPKDNDKIILKQFFEDFYYRPNEPYSPRWMLKVLDYEYADEKVAEKRKEEAALENYENEVNKAYEEIPF